MHLLGYLIIFFIGGLMIGALARLIVPGPNPIGIFGTALAGIGGSLLAGLLFRYVIAPRSTLIDFLLSVLCAAVLVAIFGRPRRRAPY